jgi:hypothetical protein
MPGQSQFNLSNKDTRDLFMLCIIFMCQLYRALFIIVARYFIIVVHLFCSLFDFDSFAFHRSLFVVQRKRFNSDPGLYSRYFDPVVQEPAVLLYKNTITIYASQ